MLLDSSKGLALILQHEAFSLGRLGEVNMTDQTKEKKPTLGDYAAEKLGLPKGKLPKDWSRVIFKR